MDVGAVPHLGAKEEVKSCQLFVCLLLFFWGVLVVFVLNTICLKEKEHRLSKSSHLLFLTLASRFPPTNTLFVVCVVCVCDFYGGWVHHCLTS